MNRMILVGRNDRIPRLSVCRDCGGTGYTFEHYNCPVEQVTVRRKVPCAACRAGAQAKSAVKGASAQPAGVPVSSPGRDASIYDATAERWIARASGTTPDAVAATDSRQTQTAQTTHDHVLRVVCSDPPGGDPNRPTPPGTFLFALQEAATVLTAMVVFGGLAFFCLVLT